MIFYFSGIQKLLGLIGLMDPANQYKLVEKRK